MATDLLTIDPPTVETSDLQSPTSPARRGIRTAAEVMTREPAVLSADASLFDAWALMHNGGHRHLVVVDDDLRALGVVDEQDIAMEWPAGPRAPHHLLLRQLVRFRSRPRVRGTDDIVKAAMTMQGARVDALPVVDAHGRLQGLLDSWHFVRLVAAGAAGTERESRPRSPREEYAPSEAAAQAAAS